MFSEKCTAGDASEKGSENLFCESPYVCFCAHLVFMSTPKEFVPHGVGRDGATITDPLDWIHDFYEGNILELRGLDPLLNNIRSIVGPFQIRVI